jgi:hypothetical protein
MAWFFIFFVLLFSISIAIIIFYDKKPINDNKLKLKLNANIPGIIIPVVVSIIALLPFLIVYLQAAKNVGMHSFDEVLFYIPHFVNLINPGEDNLLFGKISNHFFSFYYPHLNKNGEFLVGFPPIILIICLLFLINSWKNAELKVESILFRSLSLAVLISLLIMIRFGSHTIWKIIWEMVPGAKGLRVTSRYALFLIFPMALIATCFLSELSKSKPNFYTYLLAVLLMMEQVNLAENQSLNRQNQLNFLQLAGVPPSSCKSFFVVNQRPEELRKQEKGNIDLIYPHNIDAMLLSEVYGIRTINGFSTFMPSDWEFNLSPQETYMSRVAHYVNSHKIQAGICQFDLYTSRWDTAPVLVQ